MKAVRRLIPAILLPLLLLIPLLLSSCSETVPVASFADASCPFPATLYYGRYGHVRFCYESGRDILSTVENRDVISLYDSGTYSLVISYTEGIEDLSEAAASIREEFSAGDAMAVSEGERSYSEFGLPLRRSEIVCADGTSGAVLYGNTKTGFVKIYYIVAPDAPESVREHVEAILSTLSFREFFDNGEPEYDRVFFE